MATSYPERLSDRSAAFLDAEGEAAHMHAALTLVFEAGSLATRDGGIDIERLRACVAACLPAVPRYRQRPASLPLEPRRVWIDDARFDVDDHVRHVRLPRPGDDRQLKRLVSSITSQRLDRAKPLWEVWAVEGLAGGRFALIHKAHHALFDDDAARDLLSVMLQPEPGDRPMTASSFVPQPLPDAFGLLMNGVWQGVGMPLRWLGAAGRVLTSPRQIAAAAADRIADWLPGATSPLAVDPGLQRRVDWVELELGDLHGLERRLRASMNELVLATVTGALRRLLQRRGTEVDDLEIIALVPSGRIALPVGEPDPRVRVERIRGRLGALDTNASTPAPPTRAWSPSLRLAQTARHELESAPFDLPVIRVPSTLTPLYLLEARMVACYPHASLPEGRALAVAVASHADRVYWGLSADREGFPELPLFADAVVAAFEELRAAATQGRTRATRAPIVPERGRVAEA